ncbi:hypothetical protein IMY05_013G0044100 [Salix suchowensis]|nr:hypothetical protein IMY05_013G0044100 [Salix suchowensis]
MHWNLISNILVFIYIQTHTHTHTHMVAGGQCSRNLKGSSLLSCVEATGHSTVQRSSSLDHVSSRVVKYFVESHASITAP